MIEKTNAYKVGDKVFENLEAAQAAEVAVILANEIPSDSVMQVSGVIVRQREAIINALTTGPKSHPRARKANGATRKPKAKPETATP